MHHNQDKLIMYSCVHVRKTRHENQSMCTSSIHACICATAGPNIVYLCVRNVLCMHGKQCVCFAHSWIHAMQNCMWLYSWMDACMKPKMYVLPWNRICSSCIHAWMYENQYARHAFLRACMKTRICSSCIHACMYENQDMLVAYACVHVWKPGYARCVFMRACMKTRICSLRIHACMYENQYVHNVYSCVRAMCSWIYTLLVVHSCVHETTICWRCTEAGYDHRVFMFACTSGRICLSCIHVCMYGIYIRCARVKLIKPCRPVVTRSSAASRQRLCVHVWKINMSTLSIHVCMYERRSI